MQVQNSTHPYGGAKLNPKLSSQLHDQRVCLHLPLCAARSRPDEINENEQKSKWKLVSVVTNMS